jgi:hypothetical protein
LLVGQRRMAGRPCMSFFNVTDVKCQAQDADLWRKCKI